eukprot:TRINITY_DN9668_c0_g2_i1.p1 TRINITY_DN9668_c0_g2~~TRINITY_DN9668_c0_g2_i1.p1  ORF type:complete len:462 (-),score=74.16 TRINITY_DN9668_c0_g2_i1:61-1446(-)
MSDPILWSRENVYGLVLLIIILVLCPPLMIYQHIHRKSKFFVQRSYYLLAYQHAGMFFSGIVMSLSLLLTTPVDNACQHHLWSGFCIFIVFCVPLFLRATIFALRYNITQRRLQSHPVQLHKKACDKIDNRLMSWVFILSHAQSFKISAVASFIQMIPVLILSGLIANAQQQQQQAPDAVVDIRDCPYDNEREYLSIIFSFFYLLATFAAVVVLWRSNDAYYIKRELGRSVFVWVICIPLNMVCSYVPAVEKVLPSQAVIIMGLILHFWISGGYVSIMYLRSTRAIADPGDADLAQLLKNRKFRLKFSDFLCLQLCIENLSFYDAVEEYHNASPSDQPSLAKEIYLRYIVDGSQFQVNIGSALYSSIKTTIDADLANNTTFDEAKNEIFSLMKYHSLPLFLSRQKDSSSPSSSSSSGGGDTSGISSSSGDMDMDNISPSPSSYMNHHHHGAEEKTIDIRTE